MSEHFAENDAPLIGTCPDGSRCKAARECVAAQSCTRVTPPVTWKDKRR